MLARYRKAAAYGLFAATIVTTLAFRAQADGIYQVYPGVGQPSFCASTVTGVVLPSQQGPFGVVPGSTQGNNVGICAQTVPAGPATFTGNEHAAFDMAALGATGTGIPPATANVNITQLGQGGFDLNTTAGNLAIPNGTVWFMENATTTTPTLTFPSAPVEGQILHIILGANVSTGIVTAAATGSTCLPACGSVSGTTAGTGYAWRYAGTVWYRFQ